MLEYDITQILLDQLPYFFIPISRLIVVHAQLNALGNPLRKTRTSSRDLGEAPAAASG
jgi:hypothetical protein